MFLFVWFLVFPFHKLPHGMSEYIWVVRVLVLGVRSLRSGCLYADLFSSLHW